jgi:heme exporter protein C
VEELKNLWTFALGVFGVIATVYAFTVPDALNFENPKLARIFFWHFPCSIVFTGLMFWALYLCIQCLRFKSLDWDWRAAAANELGAIFATLVMTTGIIFSKTEWGEFWSWDPKQYSFLMVLLLYLAYFVLRAAITDPQARATNSAVYWCIATPAIFFITFLFPHLPSIEAHSLHPSNTIMDGLLSGDYATAVMLTLTLFICLTVLLYRQRVSAEMLKLAAENY